MERTTNTVQPVRRLSQNDSRERQRHACEEGYEWLSDRIVNCFERLDVNQIVEGSPILADDQFFHSIHRTMNRPDFDGDSGYWISTKVWSVRSVA
jgi:hypothetical protein